MAANALIPVKTPQAGFWDRFLQEATLRVDECNAIAGEILWRTAASPDPSPLFTVQSVGRPENSLECTFDFDLGKLTCKPGCAARPLVFQLVDGGTGTLRRGRTKVSLKDAVEQILDELVWTDPCSGELEGKDNLER